MKGFIYYKFYIFEIKFPENESVKGYMPGSPERASLKEELERQLANPVEIPVIIGGKEIYTGDKVKMTCPHEWKKVLGEYHMAGEKELLRAIESAEAARKEWENMPWQPMGLRC